MIGYVSSKGEKNLLKRLLNIIEIEEFENGKKYLIPKLNGKILKELNKDNIKNIVLADKDKNNIDFINTVYSNGINILDGKKLFKHLIPEIVEYLSNVLGINKQDMELTILVNDYSNINLYYINELIFKVKRINIITNNIRKFKIFADRIYEKEAIVIPIMNNKKKSMANKIIMLNIDFSEEQLKKYRINRKAIIINIENNIYEINKTFYGILINNYELNYRANINDFETNEIYESYLIGRDLKNVKEKINKDDIKIKNFIGRNGIINLNEYMEKN